MTTSIATKDELSHVCELCGRNSSETALLPIELVRGPITRLLEEKAPGRAQRGFICVEDLNGLRVACEGTLLAAEKGELSTLENPLIELNFSRRTMHATFHFWRG